MRKALAAVAIVGTLVGGVDACKSTHSSTGYSNSAYVDEVQYGYYDPGYAGNVAHYHYYTTPRQVHIPRSQYNRYRYEYQPHGTQHTVTVHHTTTTTTTHHSSTGKVTRRTTTTTKRSRTTTRSSHH